MLLGNESYQRDIIAHTTLKAVLSWELAYEEILLTMQIAIWML